MQFTLKLSFGLIVRSSLNDELPVQLTLWLVSESWLVSMLVPDCSAVLRGEGLVLILKFFEVSQVEA